jgi:hypothetical protein
VVVLKGRMYTVPCPEPIRKLLERTRLPRLHFEAAIEAAVRWEEARQRARHRAEVSRYRRLFGWTWELE